MKRFTSFITELEQDWQYMKKPKPMPAVDDLGRTINTPDLPKPEREALPPQKPFSTTQKNIRRLEDAPRGTEDSAEFNLRKQYQEPNRINMIPRRIGPENNPDREQYDTMDTKNTDTQDQMPTINVNQPRRKERLRM